MGINWIFPPLTGHKHNHSCGHSWEAYPAPAAVLGALLHLGFKSFSSLCSPLRPWMLLPSRLALLALPYPWETPFWGRVAKKKEIPTPRVKSVSSETKVPPAPSGKTQFTGSRGRIKHSSTVVFSNKFPVPSQPTWKRVQVFRVPRQAQLGWVWGVCGFQSE